MKCVVLKLILINHHIAVIVGVKKNEGVDVLMPLCPNCGDWPDGCFCEGEE